MASLNFKSNWRKNTTSTRMWEYAQGALAGPIYTLVPTLFGCEGWVGMLVGGLTGVLSGILFDMPGLTAGTIGAISTHACYLWLQEPTKSITGKYIWRYNSDGVVPGTTPAALYGLAEDAERQMINMDNGDVAYGYRTTDLPTQSYPALPPGGGATTTPSGVSDYYRQQALSGAGMPSLATAQGSPEMTLF